MDFSNFLIEAAAPERYSDSIFCGSPVSKMRGY